MKRLTVLLFSLFMMLPAAANILQSKPEPSLFGGNGFSAVQDDFLPAEQAFQFAIMAADNQQISIQFMVADGYYLYNDQFVFKTDNPKVTVGSVAFPDAEKKQDEYYGEVDIHRHVLALQVPVVNPDNLAFNLIVKYQGCADKGLCYPLETMAISESGELVQVTDSVDDLTAGSVFTDSLQKLAWTDIFYYFLIGLGLTFTPCVFPMLPILSGIVLKGQTRTIRSQLLALTYILAMALTYALLGVLMGLFGAEFNIQAKLQSPWVLIPFATFFVVFALAMFGVFELRLPAFVTQPLNKVADKTQGGSFIGAALLGICSSLIVSPCVTAPFAGILLHISATGDALGGGINLFALGLGMGVPLFVIAAGGGALLPKAGYWMVVVRNLFGVMLLAVAIWLLARIVPSSVELILWGLLTAGVGVFIGALNFGLSKTKSQYFSQLIGLFLIVYGVCAWIGAWQGNTNPLQPLKGQNTVVSVSQAATWHTIKTKAQLENLLAEAKTANKPALIDWYADWCVSCKKMEHEIFQAPDVAEKLANYQLIRFDITDTTKEQLALLQHYKLVGPPAVLFFNKNSEELGTARIVGEVNKEQFLSYLEKAHN